MVWRLASLVAPAVLWLLSLVFAIITFVPAYRDISSESVRDSLARVVQQKFRSLRVSYYILVVSLIVLVVNILIILLQV